ncbi:MAG: hypothetical protein ABSA41_20835 [Terriglobia bacterium]|jgi:hypothetical protein
MRIDEATASRQWEICFRCGRKLTADGRCPCPAKNAEDMVPLGLLEHGAYYFGTCRNARVARWNADTQRFVYVRVKLGEVFPEEIGYWVDAKSGEKRFDEFRPFGKLDSPPFEIQMTATERQWES